MYQKNKQTKHAGLTEIQRFFKFQWIEDFPVNRLIYCPDLRFYFRRDSGVNREETAKTERRQRKAPESELTVVWSVIVT